MARTIKIRIAVAVDPTGDWGSAGWSGADESKLHDYAAETMENGERRYWFEGEVEVPELPVVSVSVVPQEEVE